MPTTPIENEMQPGPPAANAANAGPRRVFITVAEVSGDRHAAQLIRSLKAMEPDIIIEGHGGPDMAAAGATVHRDTVTRAAMGWRGALRAVELSKVLRWTKRHFDANKPDIWIGVDSPSMNFHFAREAKARGIATLQYVAPQLWAWAPWRMWKLRAWVDQVACILPFEEAYFREHGVNATFVGHPLFDEMPPDRGRADDDTEPASRFPTGPPVIGLLPGSRRSIAAANFPGLLSAAVRIEGAFPGASFLVPTTPATHPVVEALLRDPGSPRPPGSPACPTRIEAKLDAFDEMVPRCDLCLTVSGTAVLHVAALGVPMIAVYRGNVVLWHGLGRWLVNARTYTLVNLLAASSPQDADPAHHIVPEFIPWFGDHKPVAALAIDLLTHPAKLKRQRRQIGDLITSLDKPGASDNVARLVMGMVVR